MNQMIGPKLGRVREMGARISLVSNFVLDRRSHSGDQVPSLDGLRGLAVLMVVFGHMSRSGVHLHPRLDLVGLGTPGVYLFFVLSSFLLTRQLLAKDKKELISARSWATYLLRRALRIYPLFITGLLLALLFPFIRQALIGPREVAFWQHLLVLEGQKIFWAIPVEVKFYLVLPFLVLVFAFLLGRRPLWALVVTLSMVIANDYLYPPAEQLYRSIALRSYLSIFLWGYLAAILHSTFIDGRPSPTVRVLLDLSAVALFAGVVMATPSAIPSLSGWVRPALGEAGYGLVWALALLAYLKSDGLVSWVLARPVIRLVGVVSFSIYMWNLVIIEWVRRAFWEVGGPAKVTIMLAGIAVLSSVSYMAIERPLIRFGARASRHRIFDISK